MRPQEAAPEEASRRTIRLYRTVVQENNINSSRPQHTLSPHWMLTLAGVTSSAAIKLNSANTRSSFITATVTDARCASEQRRSLIQSGSLISAKSGVGNH